MHSNVATFSRTILSNNFIGLLPTELGRLTQLATLVADYNGLDFSESHAVVVALLPVTMVDFLSAISSILAVIL